MNTDEKRRTFPLLDAHFLNSVAQSQAAVVLPWIALSHGSGVSKAILLGLAALIPYMLLYLPAGRISDRRDPLKVIAYLFLLSGSVLALVPLLDLATGRTSLLVAVAGCCIVGGTRPFLDGAIYRAVQSVRDHDGQIRLQGLRSSLSQAGSFGGPALGLALLGVGGAALIFAVVAGLLLLSSLTLFLTKAEPLRPAAEKRGSLSARAAFLHLFAEPRLRFIVLLTFFWNIAAMLALSLAAPLLKDHLQLTAGRSSAIVALAAATVMLLTLTLAHRLSRLCRSIPRATCLAMVAEGVVFAFFLPRVGLLAFVLYPLFLLSNSVTASLSNTERTLALPEENHSLLQVSAILFIFLGNFSGVLIASLLSALLPLATVMTVAAVAIVCCGLVAWPLAGRVARV